METVRVGVVGSGFMGRTYAEVLAKHTRGAQLVAVSVGRRAAQLATDYGIAYEPDLEALVARPDIDAVVLATPEAIRLDQVRIAAASGKHILSEKPLAPDVAQADQMIAMCREAGVTLMVSQTARYRGTLALAKQVIDEGRIGKVRQIRTYAMGTQQDYTDFVGIKPWITDPAGGSFIYDQAVHNFDYMRWLTGSEATQVFAFVETQSDAPWPGMTMMAQIRYASGALAQMNLCFELPGAEFPEHTTRFMVIGEKGLLDLDMVTNVRLGMNGNWQVLWTQPLIDFVNEPNSPIRLEAHAAMMQEFLDSLLEGRAPAVPGEDGRAAVALCEACMVSARTGQVVNLPL